MIRDAVFPDDESEILELLSLMHEDAALELPEIDASKVIERLADATAVWVAIMQDQIVGVMALQHGALWYTNDKVLGDIVFFVHPAFRASKLGIRLIQRAQDYATELGCPLFLGIVSGVDADRKNALYERLGMRHLGGFFGYNL